MKRTEDSNNTIAAVVIASAIAVVGLSYASVPLYKIFCQMTGFGGTTQKSGELGARRVEDLKNLPELENAPYLVVDFNADVSEKLKWKFQPSQPEVRVRVGETALAFFTAQNNGQDAVTGVATYNVFPPQVGQYFNKIQCFCFDEQRLKAGEQVDMPVFFFIDPEFATDPRMAGIERVTLSYTFFKAYDPDNPDPEDVEPNPGAHAPANLPAATS